MNDPLLAYHSLIRQTLPAGMPNVQYQQPNAHQMFYQPLMSRTTSGMGMQQGVMGGGMMSQWPGQQGSYWNPLLNRPARRNKLLHPRFGNVQRTR